MILDPETLRPWTSVLTLIIRIFSPGSIDATGKVVHPCATLP